MYLSSSYLFNWYTWIFYLHPWILKIQKIALAWSLSINVMNIFQVEVDVLFYTMAHIIMHLCMIESRPTSPIVMCVRDQGTSCIKAYGTVVLNVKKYSVEDCICHSPLGEEGINNDCTSCRLRSPCHPHRHHPSCPCTCCCHCQGWRSYSCTWLCS